MMKKLKKMLTIVLAASMVFIMTVPAFAAATLSGSQVKKITPTGVKAASYSYSKIRVSWNEIPGVDGYKVYRSSSLNGKYTLAYTAKSASKTSYINTGRTTGKTYYYKVRGYKKIGGTTYYTRYSSVVSVYARPNKSVITSVVRIGDKLTLSWKKISGATGYRVYAMIGGTWEFVMDTKATSESFWREEDMAYRVRAYRTVNGKRIYGLYSEAIYDYLSDEGLDGVSGEEAGENSEEEDKTTKSFFLDCYSAFIETGKPYKILATIVPVQNLTWSSSDSSVAAVSDDGTVNPLRPGTCSITVVDENGNKRTCQIYVVNSAVPTLSDPGLLNEKGEIQARIVNGDTAEYYNSTTKRWSTLPVPSLAIQGEKTWYTISSFYSFSSSDPKVATVDDCGKICAVGEGKAVITSVPKNASNKWAKTGAMTINVSSYETPKKIKVDVGDNCSMSLSGSGLYLTVCYEDGTPANMSYLGLTAESSDPSVATAVLDFQYLRVKPVAAGSATITVKTKYGTSTSFTVEVIDVETRKQEQIQKYMATINDSMTEYQKLKALCDYILDEYTYSTAGYTAEYMFAHKCGDCWAYSAIVNVYCKEIGLQSVTYKEIWNGNVRHTTNRVKADGQWYYVDCSINKGTTYDLFPTEYDG